MVCGYILVLLPRGCVSSVFTSLYSRWLREQGTLHVPDDQSTERFSRVGTSAPLHSLSLAVPLRQQGELIGSLNARRTEVRPFTPAQIKLLETFADQAVIAIENVRLFNELDERTNELTRSVGELRALGEVSQVVSSTLDLETVLTRNRFPCGPVKRHRRRGDLRIRRAIGRVPSAAQRIIWKRNSSTYFVPIQPRLGDGVARSSGSEP